jgi:hypothetical protein
LPLLTEQELKGLDDKIEDDLDQVDEGATFTLREIFACSHAGPNDLLSRCPGRMQVYISPHVLTQLFSSYLQHIESLSGKPVLSNERTPLWPMQRKRCPDSSAARSPEDESDFPVRQDGTEEAILIFP